MNITEVKVLAVDGDERLKAFVTMKLDGCFVIRDVKVIKGNTGYFVAMPAKKMKDGTYRDLVHPLDAPTRQMVEDTVLNEYRRVLEDGGAKADITKLNDKSLAML
ncbi:MAG: septation regulator SpoVG [Deltaproteobacteria bacterium]|nr:septation regulator SpoVG [Deltaproteobacteria bacterium]